MRSRLIKIIFGVLTFSGIYATDVSGTISSNTTWSLANSPYVVTGNISVNNGVTLTIEAGVTVKFDTGKVLQISGTLIARGTSDKKITFTSNASSPAAGDWGKITFLDASVDASFNGTTYTGGCILEYSTIEYGSGVLLNLGNPFINYCTVRYMDGIAIHMDSHDNDSNGNSIIRITNNTIHNNTKGIKTYGYGTVTLDNNTVNNNTDYGIYPVAYNSTVSNNTIKNNTGSGIKTSSPGGVIITNNIITGNTNSNGNGGGIDAYAGQFSNNIIYGNSARSGGGVHIDGDASLTKNIIVGNTATDNNGISELYWSGRGKTVSYNIIANNDEGYAVYDGSGGHSNYPSTFKNNAIIGFSGYEKVYNCSDCDNGTYQYNLFSQNKPSGTSTVFYLSDVPTSFSYNNFINNTASNLLYNNNSSGTTVTAENNYWGTTSSSDIASSIYDWNDDGTLGTVDYDPYLSSPNTTAPISPPAGVIAEPSGSGVKLTWTANPESDVAGYKIHYGSFTGYSYTNNVDAGNVTTYTISSGVTTDSSISVTAYDGNANGTDDQVEGYQSWFSLADPVAKVSSISSSTANGSYNAGDVIAITVTFSEAVTVTGTPQLTLETGTNDAVVDFSSGSGGTTLTFNYTVASGHTSSDLDYKSTTALALNSGTIKDSGSNNASLTLPSPGATGSLGANKALIIDTTAPTVSGVTSTTTNGTYKIGDAISVIVALNEVMTVTGTPKIQLETGTTDQYASYASGTGNDTLTFTYIVASGDTTADLDYTSTSALGLNSGTIKDAAGNTATLTLVSPGSTNSLSANKAIVIDGNVPTVSSVTSTKTDAAYAVGATIPITITFSQTVTVTGTPQLTLETGTTDAVVDYSSGTGTAILTFNYIIGTGQKSSDVDYGSTSALALNGGTIKDASGNAATLTLATPGESGSLGANKAIVVKGAYVTDVSSTSSNGTYKIGDVIPITVTFDQNVNVTGTPQIILETGTTDNTLSYASGTGNATLTFNYTVASGDTTSDLDYLSTSALGLNSGTIKDAAGNTATLTLVSPGSTNSLSANKAIVIDGNVPTVSSVTSTKTDAAYAVGATIPITITFSQTVTVTGTPQLTLETGTTDAVVDYASGTGTATLTFNYVVASGHTSIDLDYASTSALALNSGTIKDASGNATTLTLATPGATNSLGANKALIIDTTGPTVSSVSSTTTNAAYKEGNTVVITVAFNEPTYVTGTPQITLETGSKDAVVDYTSGTSTSTLTFNYVIVAGQNSSDLDYTSTSALALNSGTVKDSLGNAATLTLPSPGATGSLGANKALIVDTTSPTLVFSPANGATGVAVSSNITMTFNEFIRKTDDTALTNDNVDALITLKDTNTNGTDIAFDATINPDKTVITIDPTTDFSSEQIVYAAIGVTVEDSLDHSTAAGNTTFTIKDVIAPTVSIYPAHGDEGIGTNVVLGITFSEPIRNLDNSEITNSSAASHVSLKSVNADGANFVFSTEINANKTEIKITPLFNFDAQKVVYFAIGPTVEDDADNAITLTSSTFRTGMGADLTGPIVDGVTSSNANSTYTVGDSIKITITFNETAYVTGEPQLLLETGVTDAIASYSSGSGTKTLSFNYVITSAHNTSDLDYNNVDALTLNEGKIKDFVGNDAILTLPEPGATGSLGANKAIKIDNIGPSVKWVNSTTENGAYNAGDTLLITINFDENVLVTGTPQLNLETGSTDGTANYVSGSGDTLLVFKFGIDSLYNTDHLECLSTSALELNSGTMKDAVGNNATLTLPEPGWVNSLGANKAITIDNIAPVITLVAEGSTDGVDIDYQASSNSLAISWMGTDSVSGIMKYEYALGTQSGNFDIINWKDTTIVNSAVISGLSLWDGTKYFTSVRATDKAGNVSAVKTGDGITIDLTAPSVGTVSDGTDGDISFTASSTTLYAQWTGFKDATSGITDYEYAMGTNSGGTDTKDWTSNGMDTTVTVTSLTLTNGKNYYISVRAKDLVGNVSSVITTNGVTADLVGPTKGTVMDGLTADAEWINTDTIRASWTGFTDPLSGIKKYQYGIGKSSGASDVVDWTDNSLDTTITLKLTLEEAVTYYVSVRGVDKVDNTGEAATSDGITADFTPPSIVSASIEDNGTLPILSDSEIIFNISEPITAATSTTESNLGDTVTGTLTLDDATQVSVTLTNPFTSGDELTLTINDLKDRSGNVTSNIVYNYNIALIADYNVDGSIDAADLTVLINGWTNKDYAFELGPAAGDVPNLKPATDGKYDIMDAAVLIRMWHWNLNKSGKMRARYYVNTGKDLTYSNENSRISIQVSKDVNAIDLYFDYPQEYVSIKQVNESSSEKEIMLSHLDTLNGEFFMTAGYFEPKLQSVDLSYIIKGKEDVTITAMYRMFNSRGEVFSQGTKEITLKPIPQEFALHQNYPNPFNPVTTINYDLPQQTHVNLLIYDILGREVVKLISEEIAAGYQSVIWNTRNSFGTPVSAGIYFYQIQTKDFVKTKKMVLLK